jgi:hypothetical protein
LVVVVEVLDLEVVDQLEDQLLLDLLLPPVVEVVE